MKLVRDYSTKKGETKYTLGFVIRSIIENEFLLLEDFSNSDAIGFIHLKKRVSVKCKAGHVQTLQVGAAMNHKCRRCTKSKFSIKDLKSHAEKNGGECLSDSYFSREHKYAWECRNGHVWESSWRCVYGSKSWCPKCARIRHSENLRGSSKRKRRTLGAIRGSTD